MSPTTPSPATATATATATAIRPVAAAPARRQLQALAGAEWRMLLRNKVAALNCFALPVLTAAFFFAAAPDVAAIGVMVPVVVLGTALLFVVYYTLVTALVARRESLLLKRLRTGEASDRTVLAGVSAPFVGVTLAQALLATVAAVAFFDVPAHPRMLLFVAGGALAAVTWTMLAVASTGFTRSVEHAQITTLPLILVALLLSGLSIPLASMPEPLRAVAEVMPLTPVLQLASVGLAGTDVDGNPLSGGSLAWAAARPVLVLLGWTLAAAWWARRSMRWEARS